jgi:ADP-ribose pyrophosphatase YjhB (NUDIX family)
MRRKYEVYIDGKPLTIVEQPDSRDSSEQMLVRRVRTSGDITGALELWKSEPAAAGLVLHGADADDVWDLFRELYVFVPAAGGCVTDERRRLLAIHRSGVWDLPKGKLDEGEAVDAAALREVREECGLKKLELLRRLCETWHTYERKGRQHLKRTDWYLMRGSNTEQLVAQGEEDISEVRWMDAGEVAAMKAATYPSLLRVISAWEAAVLGPV